MKNDPTKNNTPTKTALKILEARPEVMKREIKARTTPEKKDLPSAEETRPETPIEKTLAKSKKQRDFLLREVKQQVPGKEEPGAGSTKREGDSAAFRRQENIQKWFDYNIQHGSNAPNYKGGSILAKALLGKSELGTLSDSEQRTFLDQAAVEWSKPNKRGGDYSYSKDLAIKNLAHKTNTDASLHAKVINAYTNAVIKGLDQITKTKGIDLMAAEALRSDPDSTLNKVGHRAAELAKRLKDAPVYHPAILDSISRAKPTIANAEYTAQSLLNSPRNGIGSDRYHRSLSSAIANSITHNGKKGNKANISKRINSVLGVPGGEQLLLNDKVPEGQRMWALANIIGEDGWKPKDVSKGWDSPAVSRKFLEANKVMEKFSRSPLNGAKIKGEKGLYDFIGSSASYRGYQGDDKQIQADIRNGKRSAWWENKDVNKIVTAIKSATGNNTPKVTALPVVFTSNNHGVGQLNIYKIEGGENGTKFVDHNGKIYNSVEHWSKDNDLPPGTMTYAKDMDLKGGKTELISKATPSSIDTPAEYIREGFRYAGMGLAVTGVGAMVAGSGGAGGLLLLGAGGSSLIAGGSELYEINDRGGSIANPRDGRVRGAYFEMGAGLLGIGALGATHKATQLTAAGSNYARGWRFGAAGSVIGSNMAGIGGMGNATVDLYNNWDKMSPPQRTAAAGQLAFFGALGVGVTKFSGGKVFDGFNPMALERGIRAKGNALLASNLRKDSSNGRFNYKKLQPMRLKYYGEEDGHIFGTKVTYLDENARKAYLIEIKDGKLYDANGNLFDTTDAETAFSRYRAIFVMDKQGNIYASKDHARGKFHHSSFLSGKPVAAAGDLWVEGGVIKEVTRRSGHYRPTLEQMHQFRLRLEADGIDTTKFRSHRGF